MTAPLLEIDDLHVVFRSGGPLRRRSFPALKGVSCSIRPGETLGLVGESGSGKTTIGRAILGLAPVESGTIRFDGREIQSADARQRRALSEDIQVVFQDPFSSLNPALTIEQILAEPLVAQGVPLEKARHRLRELLDRVHLPSDSLSRLPREFSGGQRQRVAIARALALSPRLIVCDEPVSGLDLRTQAAVLDLLVEIQQDTGTALLFVSHDLSVVRRISHRVMVLLHGEVIETGSAAVVTGAPQHPYTQRLLMSAPVAHPARQAERRRAREALDTREAAA
ncbi:dipeptide/oligopeptide/nickel ABC transporter ATP-binding protein [Rathayibacter sp. VKM Ac-2760]|uniref:ABC transporter ATP-binding protein n=1 Tax=Rathayibacter sp. VKM Ac-2760 TaxID=2609253 RepID=UPI0013165C80|nr:dipeptide/oligopeptide/nickel ABC transporter ATP-binding protein [Rathayibacter sp. VKM Ac-2760]QHC60168.1 ATP-binding cassette domain-containing protein [Rathayibacter sp. VKM Ac-2760]